VTETPHRDEAVAALAARDHRAAGDAYTRAGRRHLADPRPGAGLDPFGPDPKGWVRDGLRDRCLAAVCYRVAGRDDRATFRGVEGAAVARDLRTVVEDPVQRACLTEFVADCHVVGGLDGAGEVYESAAETCEADPPDDPLDRATTPLFEATTATIQQVARGPANGEIAVARDDIHGPDPVEPGPYLAHRARFKARRFPDLVGTVVREVWLAAPRGTTEYGTDAFACAACGSTDVNWTGGSVLCLRCSRPMER
jgi:hypothetical protein